MLETANFVHGSAMRSLCLVMSECFLSGCGHGHVSNLYIVDLENLATASRRYTGDIHNSTVVGLFITPVRQWKRLGRVMVDCTCLLHIGPQLNLQLHNFYLFRTCRTSSFCTVAWQLARFQLPRRIAWSLGDSLASCWLQTSQWFNNSFCSLLARSSLRTGQMRQSNSCLPLCQMFTGFKIFYTHTPQQICSKWLLNIPPHHICLSPLHSD